ncbi:helix-turn-helix domain-containing protein [Kutzneria viridogrisea]|uniref:Transcriptional regulator with XRE-family HTH domain n=1 Tax=Kutzneria viridogrisea TaxID=47990 RepID=A0ABR6B7X0_9PSEU|nr:transcriptional regulator with XRE-family HTH domain [Kutzneria viridogrisea]
MLASENPRQTLARRLRELREEHWSGQGITQLQLAEALGGKKPLSVALISSWENVAKPTTPPAPRLTAYATFFATRRSLAQQPYRVLSADQLTEQERLTREALLRELTDLRSAALQQPEAVAPVGPSGGGLLRFPEDQVITIVCARLPQELRSQLPYTDPDSPDYVELYTYSDLDALIELYGHLRAFNPNNQVNFRTAQAMEQDDYTSHLVLLGGVDWNVVTKDLIERAELPVRQLDRHADSTVGGFEINREGSQTLFAPQLSRNGQLTEDVALFYRGRSPFNVKRTVTVCNGMFGRGTLGAVRALTDARFRDRNDAYLREHSAGADSFGIITRVTIVGGKALTPDWTLAETRLLEWSGAIL